MKYYVVDAFAEAVFEGNQAGVCLLQKWPEEHVMQAIAAENNLAETAFAVREGTGYGLRWFTPAVEMDLCGHATLGTAFVISNFVEPGAEEMRFQTQSGLLTVCKKGELLELDFPARKPAPVQRTALMERAVGAPVREAYLARDLVLVLDNERTVRELQPDMELVRQLPGCHAVVVTAKGDQVDFVSRFFAPDMGVPEDSVTGSSHTELIPFWAERLGKRTMVARQLSKRGGTLYCEDCDDRVKIGGRAALYLEGEIKVAF